MRKIIHLLPQLVFGLIMRITDNLEWFPFFCKTISNMLVGCYFQLDNYYKHEFSQAMEMLFKELEASVIRKVSMIEIQSRQEKDVTPTSLQIPRLDMILYKCLVYFSIVQLNEFMNNGATREIFSLLKEDSLRHATENLSLLAIADG